jgi:hypothetical protein
VLPMSDCFEQEGCVPFLGRESKPSLEKRLRDERLESGEERRRKRENGGVGSIGGLGIVGVLSVMCVFCVFRDECV